MSQSGIGAFVGGSGGNAGGSGLLGGGAGTGPTDAFGFIQNGGNGFESTSQPYDAAINTAQNQASNYNNAAQQVGGTNAPTITNPYAAKNNLALAGVNKRQNSLMGQLNATATNGENSQAYKQYQQGVQQNAQAQTAIANSAGGGIAGAGAKRAAQEGNAMTAAGSQAGGQYTAQQAQAAAQSQMATLAGQQAQLQNQAYAASQGQANQQGLLASQQLGSNYAGELGYNALAGNEQGAQLNALQGAAQTELGTEGVSLQGQQINNQIQQEYLGTALGAGSGLASAGSYAAGQYNNSQNQNGAGGGLAGAGSSGSSGPSEADLENPYYGS